MTVTDPISQSSDATISCANSPFLHSYDTSQNTITPNTLAIAHLTRDILQPLVVCPTIDESAEPVPQANLKRKAHPSAAHSLNTRFGVFPHKSLLVPAGSQVTSSSSSGFIHILRPTPELWTISLPHRTQVVYTPDSSYILHRLRVRPGSTIIEAGAGSGSFTHASARAVYNGVYKDKSTETIDPEDENISALEGVKQGRVRSYEYHKDRAEVLRHELKVHGLQDIVTVTNKDVCVDGFSIPDDNGGDGLIGAGADAIFLDLPAPWLAIPHLTRENGTLSKTKPARICCFSPCMEQSLRTLNTLRELGWTGEELCEVSPKKQEVRRFGANGREIGAKIRPGMEEEISRPVSVEDAVSKLKHQLWKRKVKQAEQKERHAAKRRRTGNGGSAEAIPNNEDDDDMDDSDAEDCNEILSSAKLNGKDSSANGNLRLHLLKQGRVSVRTEQDLKTHTSYLVFAILPLPWTAEDEVAAKEKWPLPPRPAYSSDKDRRGREPGKLSKKEEKRLKRQANEEARKAKETKEENDDSNVA